MKIKPNRNKLLYIFCIYFIFILINSTIILNIDNTYQVVFSQGYIPPPPSSNIQSKSIQQCAQIGIIGPTYTGLDGCPKPCPTTSNNPNVANVYIPPECRNQAIGNQSGGIGVSNPITACPNIAFSVPTYKGLDGCPKPCPTTSNNPNVANVYIPPECRNQAIGNQSGGIGVSNPITACPNIAFSGPTYKGLDGCPKPCPTTSNNPNVANVYIPPECRNQAIGNQSGGIGVSNPITACPNIAFSGPTYKGLDGCPKPCPTTSNNPNVANVYIPPECRNQAIGNQSGGIGVSNPITACPNIAFSGPTYKGLDGCPKPCPTTSNNPNVANVYIPPECRNQAIGNQSGDGQYSEDNPCVSAQVYIGPTYRDQEF